MLLLAIFVSTLPFLYLFSRMEILGGFTATFANIAGLLGTVLLIWQIIIGNRFIAKRFNSDYVGKINLHTVLGIYGFFFIMTHPFFEMLANGAKFSFFLPNISTEFGRHVFIGSLAIYLYLFVWLSSALFRDKISHRTWRYLHYLPYPMLLFVFAHALEIGTFLNTFWLIKFYFIFLFLIFVIALFYKLAQLLDVGKFPYVLIGKDNFSSNVIIYKFRPLNVALVAKIGQFFFIKPSVIAESHPFTVLNIDGKSGELTFGVKTIGRFTKQLEKVQIGQTVFLDGPYGIFTKEGQNAQPKVIIAAGIGITPFVELISRFANQDTKLFYANRHLTDALYREQLKKHLGSNYIDIISEEDSNEEKVETGRLNQQILAKYLEPALIKKANFFLCGSQNFMNDISSHLKKLGVSKTQIFIEKFSY